MKYRCIIFLLISSLLSSCMAVVVAGATVGMIVYDRRSVTTLERDARIFHLAHTRIIRDAAFQNSRILVVSFNQVVLLIGQTPDASLRTAAEKIAHNIPYVKRVYDEITLGDPLPFSQRAKDTVITSQVRSQMLGRKGLESGSIRVVTENGVVYLMGIASHEQANLAVDVAREVAGVHKVVKVFQYIM